MKNNYKVYKHTSPSGKVYIGITKNPTYRRWMNGLGYKKQVVFYRAIEKYGWDNFRHEVLFDNLNEISAKCIEVDLIYYYKHLGISYNITEGGEGHKGYVMSEESKQKAIETKIKNDSFWHGYKSILDKHYDSNLSVKENQRNLQSLGYSISLNTIYTYIKHNGFQTKLSDEEILLLLDSELSLRQNRKVLLDNYNIKLSLNKINRILKIAA